MVAGPLVGMLNMVFHFSLFLSFDLSVYLETSLHSVAQIGLELSDPPSLPQVLGLQSEPWRRVEFCFLLV